MMSPQTKTGHVNLRAVHRAPICVRALVNPQSQNSEPSEHLTFDLSITGVRFCGHPQVAPGDVATVWMFFGPNQIARASGKTVRVCETDGRPECAVQFDSLEDASSQIIQEKANAVSVGNASPSVLLVRTALVRETNWLDALRARCRAVQEIGKLAETVLKHRIETAVVGSDDHEVLDEWSTAYPEIVWRSIDAKGRLRG